MRLRCSSLPLVSVCAQAAHAPEVAIVGNRDAADLGSSVHGALANLVETGQAAQQSELAAAADKWQVELWEVEKVYRMGAALWEKVRSYFPEPRAEVEMSHTADGVTLTGHSDIMAVVKSEIRLGDNKTGFLDYDAVEQMRGYGFLGLHQVETALTVWACVLRIRDGERISFRWTRDELEAWWTWLVAHLKRDEYSPGPHCAMCKRWHECPAGKSHARQTAEMVLADAANELQLTPALAIDLLDRVKLLEKVCKAVRERIKTSVASEGGEWRDADGNVLRIEEQRQKEILYAEGAAMLAEELGDRFPEVIKIGKGKVEEIVKEKAPYRSKQAAFERLLERLDAAGAINIKTVEKLEAQRAPKLVGSAT